MSAPAYVVLSFEYSGAEHTIAPGTKVQLSRIQYKWLLGLRVVDQVREAHIPRSQAFSAKPEVD